MRLAIEFASGPGYGHLHAAGCRDLRDPETVGDAETVAEANRLAHELTGWDDGEDDPDGYRFAPCTRALRRA